MIAIKIRRILNSLLASRGLVIRRVRSEFQIKAQFENALDLLLQSRRGTSDTAQEGFSGVVFSMNRPLQLDGLLRSYFSHVTSPPGLHVLYRATEDRYQRAYEELMQRYQGSDVTFYEEGDFKADVVGILQEIPQSKIFCLVDDLVFTRNVNFQYLDTLDLEDYVPSLRLGLNLKRCYTMNAVQPLPENSPHSECNGVRYVSWSWRDGVHDWGYPLSVDGNIFIRNELLCIAELADYNSPNSFEQAIQWFSDRFKARKGVCAERSMLVNMPFNKVQVDNDNIHGGVSEAAMLEYWEQGYVMDVEQYDAIENISAHQELELSLIKR